MFKCRCSGIGQIMTEPKLKVDKEAGNLSETAKGFIEEQWLNSFGYSEEVITDEIYKGLLCEQDSMALVQQVIGGEFRTKYRERLENEFLTGCPDIILKDVVEDVKTSFSLRTFRHSEMTKGYEYQLRGYMALTGLKKARLIYCLVDTPDEIVTELKKRVWFRFNCDETNEDYIRISMQIEKNHKPSLMLSPEQRIKVFEIEADPEIEAKIYTQVLKAREYYKTLTFPKYIKL